MWKISWKEYLEITAALAVVYYCAIYVLFFKKRKRGKTGTGQHIQNEKDAAVQRKDESDMR